MKRTFLLLHVALLVTLVSAQPAIGQTATFRKLSNHDSLPTLKSTPLMMSAFPITTSMALTSDRAHLRSIDIEGRVWQWPIRPPGKPTMIMDTNAESASAALSSDGRYLAFADLDGTVVLTDLDTTRELIRDTTSANHTVALRFSPRAATLAGVTVAGQLRFWDVELQQSTWQLSGAAGPVQTIAYSPKGDKIAIASHTSTVAIRRLIDGVDVEPQLISTGGSRVTACEFTPDNESIVVASADGAVSIHSLKTDRGPISMATRPFAVWSITFDQTGKRMAAGSWDGTIRIWETKSWQLIQSVKKHDESVATMILDELGMVSAGLDGRLLYWPHQGPSVESTAVISGRVDPVWVAVYSPDGKKLFVGGNKKRYVLWDLENEEQLWSRDGPATTRCAAFSPKGKILATGGDDRTIRLVHADSGKPIKTLRGHPGLISSVVFADNGETLVSGCDRGHVKLWDAATGQEKASWWKHKQQVYCGSLSSDQKWLVTGGGDWTSDNPGELIVWLGTTGRVRKRLDGHRLAVWSIVFSPDGKRFASSDSAGAVKIWNLETFEEERTLQHEMWVRALAMSPDGKTLAVARGDGSIRRWDTETWTQKESYDGHESFAFWLQYAPDGKTLVSGSNDGTVRFWKP